MIVTQKDYEREMRAGLKPDETFRPGIYRGRRGGFLERHPEMLSGKTETKIGNLHQVGSRRSPSLRNRQRSLTQRRIKRRSTMPSARSLNENENRKTFPN